MKKQQTTQTFLRYFKERNYANYRTQDKTTFSKPSLNQQRPELIYSSGSQSLVQEPLDCFSIWLIFYKIKTIFIMLLRCYLPFQHVLICELKLQKQW